VSNAFEEDLNMATVTDICTARKTQNVAHYAYLGDTYGTAELLTGSGYLFRAEGARQATLVSYKDPALMLLGLVDVADAQHDVDMLVGGYTRIACDRQMEVQ
jgi:hypothetical protein